MSSSSLFSLEGRVVVVTGASGAIGGALAAGMARAGASVALLARRPRALEQTASALGAEGLRAAAWAVDVLDSDGLATVRDEVVSRFGGVDVLVHAAGGNVASATVPDASALPSTGLAAYREVVELNLIGTVSAVEAFLPALTDGGGEGRSILTVSSLAADRALTRVGAYGAAKAGVESWTRWLAVELARRGSRVRANAIAPGFLVGDQNRALLLEPDGSPTARGQAIVEHTPAGRFGSPDDLVSTALWLSGPGARFVTGVVVPVDGGFSAFSGV